MTATIDAATRPEQRKVLVLGGTGEIGSSMVRDFRTAGYEVAFTYSSSSETAHELADELSVDAYHYDALGEGELPRIEVDILIHNSGVNLSGHGIASTTDEELMDSLRVNALSAIRSAREYHTGMKRKNFGRIVNISSIFGLVSPKNRLSYSYSKFALRGATRSLAQELAPFGITVNDICPGPVESRMLLKMAKVAVTQGRFATPEAYLQSVRDEVPMGHFIDPSCISGAALFFASDAGRMCTGTALRVDGGMLDY